MKLLIDSGNSRVKWCQDGKDSWHLVSSIQLSDVTNLSKAWRELSQPDAVYLSNVAGQKINDTLEKLIDSLWQVNVRHVSVMDKLLGLKLCYEDISQLGMDRWLGMLYAWNCLSGPCCVISCGTATTIDVIDKKGVHGGGYIIPGSNLMQRSLTEHTANIDIDYLPTANIEPGTNTRDCVAHGVALAQIASINSIVKNFKEQSGDDLGLYLTGGGASQIIEHLECEFKFDENLVLKGLGLYSEQIA